MSGFGNLGLSLAVCFCCWWLVLKDGLTAVKAGNGEACIAVWNEKKCPERGDLR